MAGMATHISVQRPAITIFLRPVFFTSPATRPSSHALTRGAVEGLLIGEDALSLRDEETAGCSRTVVKIVGTPKTFADLARPATLLMISVGS